MNKVLQLALIATLSLSSLCAEGQDFSEYQQNIYRDEVFQLISNWQSPNSEEITHPRDEVIAQLQEKAESAEHCNDMMIALDIPGLTLVNQIYLASDAKTPLLNAKVVEMSQTIGVTIDAVVIANVAKVQVYARDFGSDRGLLIVPFGALANKTWGTDGFEGSLAAACANIKNSTVKKEEKVLLASQIVRAIAIAVSARVGAEMASDKSIKDIFLRIFGCAIGVALITWPFEVLARVIRERRSIRNIDKIVKQAGYGGNLATMLAETDNPADTFGSDLLRSLKYRGQKLKKLNLYRALVPEQGMGFDDAIIQGYGFPSTDSRIANLGGQAEITSNVS